LVTATLTPTKGEPRVEPVTVEFASSSRKDVVARYEDLRQTGLPYQLIPAPGGTRHRSDPIDTEVALLLLAAVPLHDVGGGSRGAQIALEAASRGIHVTYINRYDASETVDLGLRFIHPLLEERRADNFDLDNYLARLRSSERIALVEFPERSHVATAEALSGFKVGYDLIDEWSDDALGGWWFEAEVEQRLLGRADQLFASAAVLKTNLEARSGRSVTLVPNAVNTTLFDPSRDWVRPADLPQDRILEYHGSLYGDWFSWESVAAVANQNPEATVVLIGDPPQRRPSLPANVQFLGLKPQSELPAYLAHTDVALIPFVVSPTTQAVSPLKVYEYLAMGVPVAAPPLEPLFGLPGVECDTDLAAAVSRALAASRPDPTPIRAEHSWGNRVGRFLAEFEIDLPEVHERVEIVTRPVRRYSPAERVLTEPPAR
jgi:glycosyltransferase involved in cell wall biosynthesis